MSGLNEPCSVCKKQNWKEVNKRRTQRLVNTGFMEILMEYEVTLWRCPNGHLAQTETLYDKDDLEISLGGIWYV